MHPGLSWEVKVRIAYQFPDPALYRTVSASGFVLRGRTRPPRLPDIEARVPPLRESKEEMRHSTAYRHTAEARENMSKAAKEAWERRKNAAK